MTRGGALPTPSLILAADHRARAVLTTENWAEFFGALAKALPACDGILATAQPLEGLAAAGHITARHRTYLSLNRTGLAGSVFELDDRLVASVGRAASDGWTGIKHMTRIDFEDPLTAPALELLGQVLEQARDAGLEALVEPIVWREGRIRRDTDGVVLFLGGPRTEGGRSAVLDEVRDVMEGGGAGLAMGRTIYQDPDPAEMAALVAALVHPT
jgi:hypothetical protein